MTTAPVPSLIDDQIAELTAEREALLKEIERLRTERDSLKRQLSEMLEVDTGAAEEPTQNMPPLQQMLENMMDHAAKFESAGGRKLYQPKGSMCIACRDALDNCSHLRFFNMPVLSVLGNLHIVRCTSFQRKQK